MMRILAVCLSTALVLSFFSGATAGARDGRLQQPLVPSSKLECHSAACMSLSTAVRLSDACWRTCTTQCAARFQGCVGVSWLNNCRDDGNHCNIACQKQCRTYGGPLVNLAY